MGHPHPSTEFLAWLRSRPTIIQQMGRKYPPGLYRTSQACPQLPGGPYTVELQHYSEQGHVGVMVQNYKPNAPVTADGGFLLNGPTNSETVWINPAWLNAIRP